MVSHFSLSSHVLIVNERTLASARRRTNQVRSNPLADWPTAVRLSQTTRGSNFVKRVNSVEPLRGSIDFGFLVYLRRHRIHHAHAHRVDSSSQVRTDKLESVIDAARMLRTQMKDARGGLIR
jgi:hypothetical protein